MHGVLHENICMQTLSTKAFKAPPNAPFMCVDMFAGRASIAKAFRLAGYSSVALDITFHGDFRDAPR